MNWWEMLNVLLGTLILLALLSVPIRIGVRVAQWRRRRANEAPLARFWTHPAWLVYEAVLGSAIGYVLYHDVRSVMAHNFDPATVTPIGVWIVIVFVSVFISWLAALFFRYDIQWGAWRTMSDEEWWEEWEEEEQRRDWEEYWKESNDFTTGTGSYTYMRHWYNRD